MVKNFLRSIYSRILLGTTTIFFGSCLWGKYKESASEWRLISIEDSRGRHVYEYGPEDFLSKDTPDDLPFPPLMPDELDEAEPNSELEAFSSAKSTPLLSI